MRSSLLALAAAVLLATGAQGQTTITIGTGSGAAGGSTTFDATLATNVEIAGTQNDLTPAAGVAIAAKAGKCSVTRATECFVDGDCPEGETCRGVAPDCTVNPDIDKTGTSFAFQPSGCQAAACTGIRALVLSLANVDPIPTGSVLYTCTVDIGAETVAGDYALTTSNVGASDPGGVAVPATGVNGTITVAGEPPTSDAIIHVGSTSGDIGEDGLSFDVTLEIPDAGTEVAGTQNDITFSGGIGAQIQIKAKAGKCSVTRATECFVDGDCPEGETCRGVAPDCTVNPDIDKTGTSFAFQPSNCQGEACTGIRALVLSLANVDPIPDGSVLYSCAVQINSTASGTIPLTCSNPGSSDPAGGALDTTCTNGSVTVGSTAPSSTLASAITADATEIPLVDASGFPDSGVIKIGDEVIFYTGKNGNTLTGAQRGQEGTTAAEHAAESAVTFQGALPVTPTPTVTPSPGSPTATATNTVVPPTSTRTTRPTSPSGGNDDDGCAIVAPAQSGSAWMLLLPAAALLWLRRRSR
jgi:MYXO-CTERM domain-containing protein